MKNKLVFVSGMAVGFVLGTRAGRDSYEKLKVKIRGLLEGPTHRDNVSDTAGPPRNKTPEVREPASQAGKNAKEEITGAPPHDTPKTYAPPASDFYGIGGPASHESLDTHTAQQAHRDETGGQNRPD
jgi:hypothetical protein